jgi:rRNA biogenesis protein RRP5
MLEYKHGQPESGRTMFEGIVTNFQKRMDVWSIYMDMEVKYGE